MGERLRNEVEITLKGEVRVMRATFGAIRAIERDLKINIIPLIMKLSDLGLEQAAVIVFHGLKGYGDTSLTLEEVGEAIMDAGLDNVLDPIVDFLANTLKGVSVGKPQPAGPVA
jgi:hypothetical protein